MSTQQAAGKNEELEKAIASLAGDGIDVALLSNEPDVCYVSGYSSSYQNGPHWYLLGPNLALIGRGAAPGWLLKPRVANTVADIGWAAFTNRLANLVEYSGFESFRPYDGQANYLQTMFRMFEEAGLRENDSITLGLQPEYLPSFVKEAIHRKYPKAHIVDASPALFRAGKVKTKREIQLIRNAVALSDVAQKALVELIEPGISEIELWAEVEARIMAFAGHRVHTVVELVSGPRTSSCDNFPAGPTNRLIRQQDAVRMDVIIRHDGYWTDCTNSFCVGGETPEFRRCYRVAKDALAAGVEILRPGARAADVEAAIRRTLEGHGFRALHYLGHQIGTGPCQPPRLVNYDRDIVENGMVYTVEPGAYMGTDGTSGCRLEPVYLVTHQGAEIISAFKLGR